MASFAGGFAQGLTAGAGAAGQQQQIAQQQQRQELLEEQFRAGRKDKAIANFNNIFTEFATDLKNSGAPKERQAAAIDAKIKFLQQQVAGPGGQPITMVQKLAIPTGDPGNAELLIRRLENLKTTLTSAEEKGAQLGKAEKAKARAAGGFTAAESRKQQLALRREANAIRRQALKIQAAATAAKLKISANKASKLPKPTAANLQAVNFARRMVFAHKGVLSNRFRPDRAGAALQRVAPTFTGSQRRTFEALKLNFITAVLRKESGAVISVSEFETEERKFFPQPGDSEEVIELKRRARELAIIGMLGESNGHAEARGVTFKPPKGGDGLRVTVPRSGAASPGADPLEGRTATGPNGEKVIRKNGQWVPLQ